ncbi:MAG: magnesium transporter [Candidatus Melainabacteria bacterium]|nr:magnesium transporter [Candidatus Melainabacteria bacterium]
MPSIVYLADAVGTQTETVVVRGLAVDVPISHVIWRELAAGVGIGVALGLLSAPFVWWRWGDFDVAMVVGISLVGACFVATAVGLWIPWLLNKLKLDAAAATPPLSTVIQDLTSILIYFIVASWVLH